MKFFKIFAILFCLTEILFAESKKGLVIYLDGIPASGKSSIANLLKKNEHFHYLSTDNYAESHKIFYYQSANLMFKKALSLGQNGKY